MPGAASRNSRPMSRLSLTWRLLGLLLLLSFHSEVEGSGSSASNSLSASVGSRKHARKGWFFSSSSKDEAAKPSKKPTSSKPSTSTSSAGAQDNSKKQSGESSSPAPQPPKPKDPVELILSERFTPRDELDFYKCEGKEVDNPLCALGKDYDNKKLGSGGQGGVYKLSDTECIKLFTKGNKGMNFESLVMKLQHVVADVLAALNKQGSKAQVVPCKAVKFHSVMDGLFFLQYAVEMPVLSGTFESVFSTSKNQNIVNNDVLRMQLGLKAADYLVPVLKAMKEAGVVHFDISPDNLFFKGALDKPDELVILLGDFDSAAPIRGTMQSPGMDVVSDHQKIVNFRGKEANAATFFDSILLNKPLPFLHLDADEPITWEIDAGSSVRTVFHIIMGKSMIKTRTRLREPEVVNFLQTNREKFKDAKSLLSLTEMCPHDKLCQEINKELKTKSSETHEK